MQLLVGYGNTLRRDDGVGCRIVERLAPEIASVDARVIVTQQLLPELAAEVAGAQRVIFVDAAVEGIAGAVQVCDLAPLAHLEDAHALTPPGILIWSQVLYGACPPAHLVTVTGADFSLGDTLSAPVQAALPGAIAQVRRLLAASV